MIAVKIYAVVVFSRIAIIDKTCCQNNINSLFIVGVNFETRLVGRVIGRIRPVVECCSSNRRPIYLNLAGRPQKFSVGFFKEQANIFNIAPTEALA